MIQSSSRNYGRSGACGAVEWMNPGAVGPDTAVFLTVSPFLTVKPLIGLDRVFLLLIPRYPGGWDKGGTARGARIMTY